MSSCCIINKIISFSGNRGLFKGIEGCYICFSLSSRSSVNSFWSKNYSTQVDWYWVEWNRFLWCSTIICCELKYCKFCFLNTDISLKCLFQVNREYLTIRNFFSSSSGMSYLIFKKNVVWFNSYVHHHHHCITITILIIVDVVFARA